MSQQTITKKPLKVFVVDDDSIFLELFRKKISEFRNVKLSVFHSAEECLKSMHRKPDIIYLDFYLDGEHDENMNGLFALEDILQIDPNQKVIMMSSESNDEILNKCLEKGAMDYMVKNGTNLNIGIHLSEEVIEKVSATGHPL